MADSLDTPRVGVIGGGPAGALCARILREHNIDVSVIDKGRRPGGRLSTREYPDAHFDHGAQYMTVRDPTLRDRLASWIEADVVARWNGVEVTLGRADPRQPRSERWVGVPTMSALVRHLLDEVPCRFGARATAVGDANGQLAVTLASGTTLGFDRVVVAIPAPQAATLLDQRPELAAAAASARYAPCWAVMADFDRRYQGHWASARPEHGAIAWIARNQTKPARPDRESWVVHATPEWSRAHIEDAEETTAATLIASALGLAKWDEQPAQLRAHRWRYALVESPVGVPCLFQNGVGLCGDGLLGGRIESALLSGAAMAERVLESL